MRLCCDKDPFKLPPATFTCDCNGPPYKAPHPDDCAEAAAPQ